MRTGVKDVVTWAVQELKKLHIGLMVEVAA
jgi:hypothetical protein